MTACKVETDIKEIALDQRSQFYSDLVEILANLPTHSLKLIILTKYNVDLTTIVDFLLVVYFWASAIF